MTSKEDILRMAREAGILVPAYRDHIEHLERFAELVRADEREACADLVYNSPPSDEYESPLVAVHKAIKARGNT